MAAGSVEVVRIQRTLQVADGHVLWDYPTMTLIADDKKRITLPKPVKPCDAFDCVQEGNRFVLVKLEKPTSPRSKVRLIKRNGRHTVASIGRIVTTEEVQKLIDELP